MPMNIGYLPIIYSGGAGNESESASLGGIISSAAGKRVLSQSVTIAAPTVTGVTFDYAFANALGDGTITFTYVDGSNDTLQWKQNGGTLGPAVVVGADGIYTLYDVDGIAGVCVTVVDASLPGSTLSDTDATVANLANETFDNIVKQESLDGDIEYRCFYLKNEHPTEQALNVSIYLKTDANGADSFTMGKDLAGVGNGVTTGVADIIPNENTAPDPAVSFSAPATPETAIVLGSLNPGESVAFWLKRTVPAVTTTSTPIDLSVIGYTAYI